MARPVSWPGRLVYAGCNKSEQQQRSSAPIKGKQAMQSSTLLTLHQSMLDKARRQETKKQALEAVGANSGRGKGPKAW